jgi:hypothetical protein
VLCYDFDSEQLLTVYDFADSVTSTVLPGLEVDFSQIVENL